MVRRALQGVSCGNYKQVDYDEIKNVIAEKKFTGQESLVKLKKIEVDARHRRDSNLLKQHQNIWNRELTRLSALRQQIEADIDSLANGTLFEDSDNLLQELYEKLWIDCDKLDNEFAKFKESTVNPVWQLR